VSEENVYSEKEVSAIVARYKSLCARAADALEEVAAYAFGAQALQICEIAEHELIAELRKAAE